MYFGLYFGNAYRTELVSFLGNHKSNRRLIEPVEYAQHNQDQFCLRRTAFYSQLKSKVGNMKELGPANPHHALVQA
jgi:hypothetical protein